MSIRTRFINGVITAVAVCLLLPALPAMASGARQSDKARHGEIVLLRDVSARHAYRPMPPGMAVIVDPSPRTEIERFLGTGELSEDEYAALGAGNGAAPLPGPTTVEQMTRQAMGGSLGAMGGNSGVLSGAGMTRSLSVPIGAVHSATGGIADQIKGALSQFPGMAQPATPPAAGGPGGG